MNQMNRRQPKISAGPGFGDYLRSARTSRSLSLRALADAAGLSSGSISPIESRRYARPSHALLVSLSAALQVPILCISAVAGYADPDLLDVTLDHVWDILGKFVPATRSVDWWSCNGGQYLATVRAQADISVEAAALHWSELWSPAITAQEWLQLEATGQLPPSWRAAAALSTLSQVPGSWLWGLLVAAAPDAAVEPDVIGLAFVMGRITKKLCVSWKAQTDYLQLIEAFRTSRHTVDNDDNFIPTFRSITQQADWTIPSLKTDTALIPAAAASDLSPDESTLLTHYRMLSSSQKAAIHRIITDLAPNKDAPQGE